MDIRRFRPTKTNPNALQLNHIEETNKREDSKMVETSKVMSLTLIDKRSIKFGDLEINDN